MAFCIKCGKKIEDQNNFCPYCGEALPSEAYAFVKSPTADAEENPAEQADCEVPEASACDDPVEASACDDPVIVEAAVVESNAAADYITVNQYAENNAANGKKGNVLGIISFVFAMLYVTGTGIGGMALSGVISFLLGGTAAVLGLISLIKSRNAKGGKIFAIIGLILGALGLVDALVKFLLLIIYGSEQAFWDFLDTIIPSIN